jgi:hypothetical protein
MKNKNKAKISYEAEADVLMWEIADQPIDFATEIGNVVVHFTKDNVPVLIEILEASKFLRQANKFTEKRREIVISGQYTVL